MIFAPTDRSEREAVRETIPVWAEVPNDGRDHDGNDREIRDCFRVNRYGK